MATAILERPTKWESAIEDPDPLFEIINGQRVDLPPMGIQAVFIASELHITLGYFTRTQVLGQTVIEALFELPINGDRNRRPDLAFVSFERWAQGLPVPEDGN